MTSQTPSSSYKKQLLDLLTVHLPDMLWVKDLEGTYIYANKSICENLLMAENIEEPIGKKDVFFAMREREKHKDKPDWHTFGELCFNSDLDVISKNKAMRFEEYGNIKGKLMYLEVHKAPFYDEEGNIIGTVGSGRDITEYKSMQLNLEKESYKLNEAQRIGNIGTWELDLTTGKATCSDTLYKIYGEDKTMYIPTLENHESFCEYDDIKKVREKIKLCIRNKIIVEINFKIHRKDGKKIHLLSRVEATFNSDGKAVRLLGSSMDVTYDVKLKQTLQKQKEIFEYQANYDLLTKLPNRALFLDRLQQAIYHARRNSKKVAVLFIDLDHFKEINDSLGHNVGDNVLVGIAKRMRKELRDTDTIARLGGDEFCVILNDIKSNQDISQVIKEGMKILEEPILINEHVLHVGMSIGISIYPQDGKDKITLLKNADAAMYSAKANGRNTYMFYDKLMTDNATEHLTIERKIRNGLKNDEFKPYFQPQIDARTGELKGMELLVRWQVDGETISYPNQFLPIAQKAGLIAELDRYLMNKAMAIYTNWKEEGLCTGKLAINLVPTNLESNDFVDVLVEMLHENNCLSSCIELEVTEGSVMNNPEEAIKRLKKLDDMGISIAIDDFGTGYSSLSYLKKFPIKKLKIDRSFVMDIPENEDDKGIVKIIINLCEILKIDVIAEGVETKEQENFLVENGCHMIQGNLYSKPLSSDDMYQYLKAFC